MRLVLLTVVVMMAFAANSVLNRAAVGTGAIGPLTFALVRLGTGAAALLLVLAFTHVREWPTRQRALIGSASLLAYMFGFSVAYLGLDAGLGALILFGGVQVTMFAGAVGAGQLPPWPRWAGSAIALAGLGWLFWPDNPEPIDPGSALFMAVAAVGWGIYSLNGQGGRDPLAATALNFALTIPVASGLLLAFGTSEPITTQGLVLATASGVVTSGMGYALWYAVLPRIDASVVALAQLTVPVIAITGGFAFLAEPVTATVLIGAALVVGGVALGLLAGRR